MPRPLHTINTNSRILVITRVRELLNVVVRKYLEFQYLNFDIVQPVEYLTFIPRGIEFGTWVLGFS